MKLKLPNRQIKITSSECTTYTVGTSDLPDIYAKATGLRVEGIYFRIITSAYVCYNYSLTGVSPSEAIHQKYEVYYIAIITVL